MTGSAGGLMMAVTVQMYRPRNARGIYIYRYILKDRRVWITMERWARAKYQPVLPLGEDGRRITGSREHIMLSRDAAKEGMVLLKNQKDVLPLAKGSRVALFGKATFDYVKGGGGSGDVTVAYTRNLYEGLKKKAGNV